MIKTKNRYTFNIGVNNLYVWALSQKLPVNNFEWIKDTSQFKEDFIENYNEESDEDYFLEVDVQYFEKLHGVVANLHNKTECVLHVRNLKQALNHGLVLKIADKVIKFN